jgi:hypothetical protein
VISLVQLKLRFLHGHGDHLPSFSFCDLVKKERLCTFASGRGDELRYFFYKCLLGLNCLFYRKIFSFNVNGKITDCMDPI